MDHIEYPGDDTPLLSLREGFDAMRHFLEAYWERGNRSDDIGSVLSDMDGSMTNDAGPLDPAQWSDWLEAVSKVRNGAQNKRN